MTETTYESIEALIQDVEVNGSQVRCTFLHADGETICTEGKTLSIELLPSQLELLVM